LAANKQGISKFEMLTNIIIAYLIICGLMAIGAVIRLSMKWLEKILA